MALSLLALIVLCSLWVGLDARRLGVRKGTINGFFDMGSGSWFIASLLLWVVAFPAYLFKRPQIIEAIERASSQQKVAIKCPSCGQIYRFNARQLPSEKNALRCRQCGHSFVFRCSSTKKSQAAEIDGQAGRLIVFIGSALLIAGTFTPIMHLPIVGNITYFRSGNPDALILIGFAILATVAYILGFSRLVSWSGLLSVALLSFSFFHVIFQIHSVTAKTHTELQNNPFAGIADAFMQSVGLEWGWLVMFSGALMIIFRQALAERFNI